MVYSIKYFPINIEKHFEKAVIFRADAFEISYGNKMHFNPENEADTSKYRAYLIQRLKHFPSGNIHLFMDKTIIGPIEPNITTNARKEKIGYLNFIYLSPKYRFYGYGNCAHGYIVNVFRELNIDKMGLQVSKRNISARRFYSKHGWKLSELMNIDDTNFYMELRI